MNRAISTQDARGEGGELSRRPMVPAFLLSAICHVALLLILSLIVVGSAAGPISSELMVSYAEQFSFEESPAFELQSEPEPLPDLTTPPLEETKIDVDIAPLAKLAPIVKQQPVSATREETPTANEQAAQDSSATDSLATPATRVALSIQERVSQAGGKKGEVQFALAWKNVNDVDLHVIAPAGERISHLHRRTQSGGMLDVDMNVRGESEQPVENVRWVNNAPWGRYTVLINLFRIHRPATGNRVYRGSPFQLLAQLGSDSQIKSDTVSQGQQVAVFRFQYVPQSLPEGERLRLTEQIRTLQEQDENQAQPLLEKALSAKNQTLRDRLLNNLIIRFPHTDAAIEAMRKLGGNISKT